MVLLVLVITLCALREPRFLQPTSLNSILLWVPMIAVVAIGQMMVIVMRGIDISVGSTIGFSGMAVGMLFRSHPELNVVVGALAGVAVGLVLGSLNGTLISAARVPPIIATLGTFSVYRGLVFIISHGEQVDSNYIPDDLTRWSLQGPVHLGGVVVPWILVIALLLVVGASWFMKQTRAGRDVYAVGSNPDAAQLRGVAVGRTTFFVYAITGALAGLAGVFYASRFGFVNPATAGQGMEMIIIAATVIGGTNVTGGSGTVFGALLGSVLLGAISVALAVLGVDATWQQLVYGVVILLAVTVDVLVRASLARSQEAV